MGMVDERLANQESEPDEVDQGAKPAENVLLILKYIPIACDNRSLATLNTIHSKFWDTITQKQSEQQSNQLIKGQEIYAG